MPPVSRWLVAAAFAAAGFAFPAKAGVEEGVKLWRAGNYAGAVAEWQGPAAAGNRDAQFNLGQAYKLGRGVPVDPAKAIEFYRKAAAQGHEPAEANLGWVLFQQGQRKEALPMLERGAARGDAHSQYLLGVTYFNGDVIAPDWQRAYQLMTAAAAAGLPQAREARAEMDARIPLAERQKALAAVGKPVSRPATSAPAAIGAAKAGVPATGDWRVQLGAFSNQKAAATAWARLSGKVASFASLAPVYVNNGQVVRLQAGPIPDKSAATNLCAKAAAAGSACFPIRP